VLQGREFENNSRDESGLCNAPINYFLLMLISTRINRLVKSDLSLVIPGSLPNAITTAVFILGILLTKSTGQPVIEALGLTGQPITSLGMYGNVVTIGTDGEGVFYQDAEFLPDSGWVNLGLGGKNVAAVYPHKSGPLGWGITAGVFPAGDDSTYVYCSFMGGEFIPNSLGISDSLTEGVYRLAGFPDATICGEKYAAAGRVLYRQGFADSLWVPVYESPGLEGLGVIDVRTHEDAGGIVLAGGSEGYTGILLIKSADYGDTWEPLYPPGSIRRIEFSVDSSHTEIRTIWLSHDSRLSRSDDGGATWEVIYDGGGWYYFTSLLYIDAWDLLFAAGGDGLDTTGAVLLYSTDRGTTWNRVTLTISGPIVDLGDWDGQLYFAAPYSGVYRFHLAPLVTRPDPPFPSAFRLYQNVPNPFNALTTIRYEIPEFSTVRLTIYDLTGREVAVLVDREQGAGVRTVTWDASQVASEVYFYRLVAGKQQITRKLVVLK
jgi:hypothetical protein